MERRWSREGVWPRRSLALGPCCVCRVAEKEIASDAFDQKMVDGFKGVREIQAKVRSGTTRQCSKRRPWRLLAECGSVSSVSCRCE